MISFGKSTWPTRSPTQQLDAVCDRFEAAWRSGARPTLEGFLTESPEDVRVPGFRELLEVKLLSSQIGRTDLRGLISPPLPATSRHH